MEYCIHEEIVALLRNVEYGGLAMEYTWAISELYKLEEYFADFIPKEYDIVGIEFNIRNELVVEFMCEGTI